MLINIQILLLKVNIMMKNVVDVVLGGVSYWAIGYGLSYGSDTVNLISITILFKSRKEKHEVWVTAILEQWLTLCFVFVDKHEYQKYNKVELGEQLYL